ncbi:MAG TPA: hypothetical protein VE967_17015 [Gemmatimonadaceae bacterium]|nr:hypothetical protein [Gemmatimonadaceae bacterium]
MALFFGMVVVACVFAARCTTALSYDGSWYLYKVLDLQRPYLPDHRYSDALLQYPVLLASHVTSNVRVLALIFSFAYGSVTVLSLAACWWILPRQRRSAFVWVAIGTATAVLPGWIFAVGESMVAIPLFWPILIGVASALPRRAIAIVVVSAGLLFFVHPVAAPYFLLAALTALVTARHAPERAKLLRAFGAGFVVLAALKTVLFFAQRSPYERGEMSVADQVAHFNAGAAGIPAFVVLAGWVVLLLMIARRRSPPDAVARRTRDVELTLMGVAVLLLLLWARDPSEWRAALDYRELALFSVMPFMLTAAWECAHAIDIGEDEAAHRRTLTNAAGFAFAVVVVVQASVWSALQRRLRDEMATSPTPCVALESVKWVAGTPLYHWATPVYAVLLQGRAPERLALPARDCADAMTSGRIHIKRTEFFSEYRARSGGWFDFSRAGLSDGR